ncbi:hypothetical protein LTR37_015232 [Vermiconidia calcicola]|uniref:Uncharacterized protein n=1 Tax=Vermiconidia calcicola TaxID=1690605 RepID=A0ACC3MSK7_9PEZI|nr:hypothetical protein LTR37_015232 [Vermiconidia calcicola]
MANNLEASNGLRREYERLVRKKQATSSELEELDGQLERVQGVLKGINRRRMEKVTEMEDVEARLAITQQLLQASQTGRSRAPTLSAQSIHSNNLEQELARAMQPNSTNASAPLVARDASNTLPSLESARAVQSSSTNASAPSVDSEGSITLSASRKKTQPPAMDASQARCHANYPIISDTYPTIVRIDGKAVSIYCFIGSCEANGIASYARRFFRGLRGLHLHIRSAHSEVAAMDIHEVAQKCNKSTVSEQDLEQLLRNGELPTPIKLVCNVRDNSNNGAEGDSEANLAQFAGSQRMQEPYTHVIPVDGKWVELSCNICGANSLKGKREIFKGIGGILVHVKNLHGRTVCAEDGLDFCAKRTISDAHVALMMQTPPCKPYRCLCVGWSVACRTR